MLACGIILLTAFLTQYPCTGSVQRDDYILLSDTLPDSRFRPPIGNGHIATNAMSDTIYMNGLFNGEEDKSSRARIPAFVTADVNTTSFENVTRSYELDMYHGLFEQRLQTHKAVIHITYYAHRVNTRLFVTSINVRRRRGVSGAVKVPLYSREGAESGDFIWEHQLADDTGLPPSTRYHKGVVKATEIPGKRKPEVHVYHMEIPPYITLSENESETSLLLIASFSQDRDDAVNAYKDGNNDKALLSTHIQTWETTWLTGRIDIEGNKALSGNVAAAMYNILCSLADKDDHITDFFGLSPGGLSRGGLLVPDMPGGGHNDYAGHVFWDQDTWMMPAVMMFRPDMARRMIGSRTRVLQQVRKNAQDGGYRGVKFPWEQATTGIEATPKWAGNMSRFEIHISADISYGLRQYLYVSDDVNLVLHEHGFELAMEIARFWQSRTTARTDGQLDILGVMGPDEYHFNIDNSVFTNYNAKLSLTLPAYIVGKFHLDVNDSVHAELNQFQSTADKIVILFDDQLRYHPQYAGFNLSGGQIKQSDVVLLGYPLMMPMSREIRRNDLELYEKITNPAGPDTGTWSMHTVGWLELGNEAKAEQNFRMMLRNVNDPFKVFSEKPVTNSSNGGCVNFITGAGGLLQSVIFGYGGVRLREDSLDLNPYLVPGASSWSLIGLRYRGAVLDILIEQDTMRIVIMKTPSSFAIKVETDDGRYTTLNQGERFMSDRRAATVRLITNKTSNGAGMMYSSMYTLVTLWLTIFSIFKISV